MKVTKLWFADDRIYILTDGGETLWQSLLWYPRLKNATPEQRNRYRIDEEGIRWAEIDEDVSFESFTYDNPEPTGLNRIFREHPEIKPTSVAARLGISQPLFSDYLREKKTPSPERLESIKAEIRKIGAELAAI
ncbi:DUF2442 domain-containing protein [Alistipes dispar]|uniref:DUF2442 domain-containing protein n=1 Tax=Alistipes dispar TaxID=2585119 RepID=UPI003A8879FC